jgi:hypothetical protein
MTEQGKTFSQTYDIIMEAHGDKVMGQATVHKRFRSFKELTVAGGKGMPFSNSS